MFEWILVQRISLDRASDENWEKIVFISLFICLDDNSVAF